MKKLRCLGLIILSLLLSLGNIEVFAEELVNDENVEEGTLVEDEEDLSVVENIRILSFNPGYSETGEYFELINLSKKSISLAGLSVFYTTSSGKEYLVYEFPRGSEMVGESLLMRLSSSEEVKEAEDYHEVADEIYSRNMAQGTGKIELRYSEDLVGPGGLGGSGPGLVDGSPGVGIDENGTFEMLCWGFEDERCFAGFNSKKPTVLVRNLEAEEMEELFTHVLVTDYTPKYNPLEPGLIIHEVEEEKIELKCRGLEFSEILTYFEGSAGEQFVEIYNRGEEKLEISGCFLSYKGKKYGLSGEVLANGFLTVYPLNEWELNLTKNPTSVNTLEIVDVDGEVVDSLSYYSGQKKGVALAFFGFDADGKEIWRQTYIPTPGEENRLQEFKTCPVGKVINLETGNCVNETAVVATPAACPEGKYRNPLTGRCKSYATTASAELKPCAEGYERNLETGRCRKIVKNDGVEYPVEVETFTEKKEFVAVWTIVAVVVAGVGYIIFQYREEIGKILKRGK